MSGPDWDYDPAATYECAFCGQIIEHTGWDPCEVTVNAARSQGNRPGLWSFWAHAGCMPKAFSDDLRRQVGADYESPS